jgi:hypothetical protein
MDDRSRNLQLTWGEAAADTTSGTTCLDASRLPPPFRRCEMATSLEALARPGERRDSEDVHHYHWRAQRALRAHSQ